MKIALSIDIWIYAYFQSIAKMKKLLIPQYDEGERYDSVLLCSLFQALR